MNNKASTPGPLAGVRVIDLSGVVVGPVATLLMGEQGAEIIKVEPPGGDLMRKLGGRGIEPAMAPKFLHLNRNKKSIQLDLKKADDKAILLNLIEGADVLVSNMRPRALDKLGLSWSDLSLRNPRLVHCTITGFATGGPYEGTPAYDTIIQGAAGVAACTNAAHGEPLFAPFVLADHVVGLIAAQAVTAALFARSISGRGQAVEVPMFENMAAFVLCEHLGQRTFGEGGAFGDPRILNPDARPLKTQDGYICVSANTDVQARGFFSAIGRPELADDARFISVEARLENVNAYFEVRAQAVQRRTTSEWLALFAAHDVPAMQVNLFEDLIADPQLIASGTLVTEPGRAPMLGVRHANRYSHSGVPDAVFAPRLDQHGEEIRAALKGKGG